MRAWAIGASLSRALDAVEHWMQDSSGDFPSCPEITITKAGLEVLADLVKRRRQFHRNGSRCLAALADKMSPFAAQKRTPPPEAGTVMNILPDTRKGTFEYLDTYAAQHRQGDARRNTAPPGSTTAKDALSQRAFQRSMEARAQADSARLDPEAAPSVSAFFDGIASRQADIALKAELDIQDQIAAASHERSEGMAWYGAQDDACRPALGDGPAPLPDQEQIEGAALWAEADLVAGLHVLPDPCGDTNAATMSCQPPAVDPPGGEHPADVDPADATPAADRAPVDDLLGVIFHDRVPPDVREAFLGEQTRLLVGDAKFALMLEAAIKTAVDAACAADLRERAALLELVHTLSRTAVMHGELHLMFHACQAAYKLFWSMLLGPCASRLRKTGRNPDKGPVESWEVHLADQSEALDAVVLLKLIQLAEDRPAELDGLFNATGQLVYPVLAALFDAPPTNDSDCDDAVYHEFSQQTAAAVAALAGVREHVTVFMDVYTKELTAVFQYTQKRTYTLLTMRSTEMVRYIMSEYCRLLWDENRTITDRHRAKLLDEKCEGLNGDVKPLAGDRGDMCDYGEIAPHVSRSRHAFDTAVGLREDVGGGLGAKPDDLIELTLLLQGAGLGSGGGGSVGDATISEHAVPSVTVAMWLALPGAVVVATDSEAKEIKGVVVRAQMDRAASSRTVVIDWGGSHGVETVPFADVDTSNVDYKEHTSKAVTDALAEETKGDRRVSDHGARKTLAAYVGAGAAGDMSPSAAADSFSSSTLADKHEAEVTPRHPMPGDAIAHVFTGHHAGWYVGIVDSVEDGHFLTKYRGDPRLYPHTLALHAYDTLWALLKGDRAATLTPTLATTAATPPQLRRRGAVVLASLPRSFGLRVDDLVNRVRRHTASEANDNAMEESVDRHGTAVRDRGGGTERASVLGKALLERVSSAGGSSSEEAVKRQAPVKSVGVPAQAHKARHAGRAALIRGEVAKRRVTVHKARAAAMRLALDTHARADHEAEASMASVADGTAASDLDQALDTVHRAEARLIAEHDEVIARIALIEQIGDAATDEDRAGLKSLVDRLVATESALDSLQGLDVDDPTLDSTGTQ